MKKKEQAEALRLRREEHLSIGQIASQLKVSKGSVSRWVRGFPLPKKVLKERLAANGRRSSAIRRARRERPESNLAKLLRGKKISRHSKAKAAEAAVLLRLTLLGAEVYGSPFDGDKPDWVVRTPRGLVVIQVKWGLKATKGAPYIKLMCSDGRKRRRKYKRGEFDYVVGYDLHSDTAFVWSFDEIEGQRTVSFKDDHAEAWDKMGMYASGEAAGLSTR
jgi:transcriptional regulator with XRE-family HTH domain